jgi:hypothetical protein
MPITYRIDREIKRIFTRCSGETTLREVLAHFDELELDPDCPPRADVLLDLSEITNLPNVGQIRTAAERTGDASRKVGFNACAVVVGSEAWFGMARVFEAFTEPHFTRTAVFRSVEAAESWLEDSAPH